MIQANEFRIGNLVMDDITDRIGKVISIGTQHISVKYEKSTNRQSYKKEVEPPVRGISITEDILLKAGFTKNGEEFTIPYARVEDSEVSYIVVGKFNHDYWYVGAGNKNEGSQVALNAYRFVHELQNICYMLKGEELTINF